MFNNVKAICFTVGLISIAVLVLLGLAIIWGAVTNTVFAWRVAMTFGLFLLASSITLAYSNRLGR